MANLYEILGVLPNASTLAIRQAFRRLALRLHPDKQAERGDKSEKGPEAFYLIKEAAEKLLDAHQRKLYDRKLGIFQVRESGMISDTYHLWKDFEEVDIEGVGSSWSAGGAPLSGEDGLSPPALPDSAAATRSNSNDQNNNNNNSSGGTDMISGHVQEGIPVKGEKKYSTGEMHVFQMECRCGGRYEVVMVEEKRKNPARPSSLASAGVVHMREAREGKENNGEQNAKCSRSDQETYYSLLRNSASQDIQQEKVSADPVMSTALLTSNFKKSPPPTQYIVECDNCSLVIRVLADK